jgi:hypothetical protein
VDGFDLFFKGNHMGMPAPAGALHPGAGLSDDVLGQLHDFPLTAFRAGKPGRIKTVN